MGEMVGVSVMVDVNVMVGVLVMVADAVGVALGEGEFVGVKVTVLDGVAEKYLAVSVMATLVLVCAAFS